MRLLTGPSVSIRSIVLLLAMTGLISVSLGIYAVQGHATSNDLATLLDSGNRSAEDKARDPGRKPAAVLEFLEIRPGMTVMDLIAASGYYTEVLSIAVGPRGRVFAQNPAFVLEFREGANDKAMTARLAKDRLPNVERLDREVDALGLEPNSLDAVVTALNFHDVYNGRGPEAAQKMLETIYRLLKPGGVLGLIDHSGNPGADNEKLHRIEEKLAIETARKAGFIVEATSDVLRHPEDDRTQFVFAEGMRGATDRFVLRLRKPR